MCWRMLDRVWVWVYVCLLVLSFLNIWLIIWYMPNMLKNDVSQKDGRKGRRKLQNGSHVWQKHSG